MYAAVVAAHASSLQTPALPLKGWENLHRTHSSTAEVTPSPSCHRALHLRLVHTITLGSTHQPNALLNWNWVTLWISASLESHIRGRKCPPLLIKTRPCPCIISPILRAFGPWWHRPFSFEILLCTGELGYEQKHIPKGKTAPGVEIRLFLDQQLCWRSWALTCRNWRSHHILTWKHPGAVGQVTLQMGHRILSHLYTFLMFFPLLTNVARALWYWVGKLFKMQNVLW